MLGLRSAATLALSLSLGCGPNLAALVRSRASEDLHCPGREIEVERRAAGGMRATGCGLTETYVCTERGYGYICTREAGDVVVTDAPARSDESLMRALEMARPDLAACFSSDVLRIRLTIDTQGRVSYAAPARGSASAADERCVAAAFEGVDLHEPAATPRTAVLDVPRDWRPAEPDHHVFAIETTDAPAEAALDPATEAAARSAIDGRRDAILACAGVGTVALEVDVAADGQLTFSLRGDLAGGAEERCVRAALAGLAITAPPAAPGALIHVVTAP